MARRSSQDPSDPYREFWEHPGRSSRRSGRRPGPRRTERTEREGSRAPRPRPAPPKDPRPAPRASFDPRAPQDPRAYDRRPGPAARTATYADLRYGGRPQVDARTAFAEDAPRSRRPPARQRTAARASGPSAPAGPRRPADGLTIGSLVIVFAVGLATLAAVENSLLTGGLPEASGTRAADAGRTATPRPGRSTPGPRRPAQPPVQTLNDSVNQHTLRQRGPAARQSYGGDRAPLSGAVRFSSDRTWALGTTAIPVPADREAMPQVALYLARWEGESWRIALSGTQEFGDLLTRVPAQMMPADERRTLARFSSGAAQGTTPGGLMLPWQEGRTWAMTATALQGQAARPLGTVAFRGGDGRVLAAGPGRVYRFCVTGEGRGMVMVIHPDGLATTYYHLTGVPAVRDGGPVARGDLLGRIGTDRPCGGAPVDRPQVRFGLRSGSEDLPFEGVSLGGWTFRERARPLVGWAERGLLQVLPGGLLRNFGPDAPPADDPNATPDPEEPGPPRVGQSARPPTQS